MNTSLFEQRRAEAMKLQGPELFQYLEDKTGEWHDGAGENVSLREYLGLTKDEYQVFAINPTELVLR